MDKMIDKATKKLAGDKPKKKGMFRMHIEPLEDKKYLVEHQPMDIADGSKSQRFAHNSLDELKAHMDSHWGEAKGSAQENDRAISNNPVTPAKDDYQPEDAK